MTRKYDDLSSSSSASSPPRKKPRLEKIKYTADESQHRDMDNAIFEWGWVAAIASDHRFTIGPQDLSVDLLRIIVEHAPDLDQSFAKRDAAKNLLNTVDGLVDELQQAWDVKGFASIRDLAILHPSQVARRQLHEITLVSNGQQLEATAAAWRTPYVPGPDKVFLKTINQRYNKPMEVMYAHHVALVQSSGTGKSRMLHEVSHQVFTVIMNFGTGTGFPGPDERVRDYLTKTNTAAKCQHNVVTFLIALFDKLSEGSFKSPSDLSTLLGYGDPNKWQARVAYFDDILSTTNQMEVKPTTPKVDGSPTLPSVQTPAGDRTLLEAATNCIKALVKKSQSNQQPQDNVLLILGFDEAAELTSTKNQWDAFTELRRTLRAIRILPIYSVFMSTTGSVRQFHPCQYQDRSSRIQDGRLRVWPPYTLVGFDRLASRLKEGDTLDDATKIEYLLGLGRPLFKTRYDNGSTEVKNSIVQFARYKLLKGEDGEHIGLEGKIAPLAVRLPLAFNALNPKAREIEEKQVEAHMRICLNIVPEADVMYTVAPSEPILAEAAAQIMLDREQTQPIHSVEVLHQFLVGRYLSKGDRGELACMLLMLLARDKACFARPNRHPLMPHHTPLPVVDFLKSLFAETHHETILKARATENGPSLQEVFNNSWVHFTHFIKVTDYKVVKFLLQMIARGAAVLCADNQLGLDFIIPFVFQCNKLHRDTIGGILGQSKNAKKLGKSLSTLFAKMDPGFTGIFDKQSQGNVPVIKIVFGVGMPKPEFTCLTPQPDYQKTRSAKTAQSSRHFGFFAASMSHEVFRPIRAPDELKWKELILRSGIEDIFPLGEDKEKLDIARSMTPCAQAEPQHWDAFFSLEQADSFEVEVEANCDTDSCSDME